MITLSQTQQKCPLVCRKPQVLSTEEIDEVSGGLMLPGAAVGAVIGGVAYAIDSGFSGGSWTGFAVAVGMGALSGAVGGSVHVVSAVWGFNATVVGSTAGAVVKKMGR